MSKSVILKNLSLKTLIFNFLSLREFIFPKERVACLQLFFPNELLLFNNLLLEMKVLIKHRLLENFCSLEDLKKELKKFKKDLSESENQIRELLYRLPLEKSSQMSKSFEQVRRVSSTLMSFAKNSISSNQFFDQSVVEALQNSVNAVFKVHQCVLSVDNFSQKQIDELKLAFLNRLISRRTVFILKSLLEDLSPLEEMQINFSGKVYSVCFLMSPLIEIYYNFLFLSKLQQSAESNKGTVKLDLGFSNHFLFLAKIMRDNNFVLKQEKVQGVLQIVEYMLLLIPYSLNIQLLFLDYKIFEYQTTINFYMILFVIAFLLQLSFFISHHSYNSKLSSLLKKKTRVFPIHTVSLLLFKCFTQQVLFTLGLQFRKPYLFNLMLTIEWFVVFAPIFKKIKRVTLDFMVPAFLLLILVILIKLIFSKVFFIFSPSLAPATSSDLHAPSFLNVLKITFQLIYYNFLNKVGFDIQSEDFRSKSTVLSPDLKISQANPFKTLASTYSFLKDNTFNLLIFLSSKTFFVITLSTLREFRKKAARQQSQIKNRCLICGRTKSFLEEIGENFNDHINKDHSIKRFLSLMFLFKFQESSYLDFISFRLKNLLQDNDPALFNFFKYF